MSDRWVKYYFHHSGGFMQREEFEEEIKAYAEEIEGIRKRKDFEMLKALAGDLRDFLRMNANKFKWGSELCEKEKGFMGKSYKVVRERAQYKCELCGGQGVDIHHLAGRSPLKVYHLPEFLIYLCRNCHRRFHGG